MNRADEDHPVASPRNRSARAALVIAPVLLVQPASVFYYYVTLNLGFGPLGVTNAAHPLSGLVDLVAASSVLCLPVDPFLGLPALILGVIGLRASRSLPGRAGRREAIAAIAMGVLTPLLSAMNYCFMAADWRQ
jgi:hypothetical protein